jgi:beta-barrel assembly-enhancing protease
MQTFDASYYDGHVSRKFAVTVTADVTGLRIEPKVDESAEASTPDIENLLHKLVEQRFRPQEDVRSQATFAPAVDTNPTEEGANPIEIAQEKLSAGLHEQADLPAFWPYDLIAVEHTATPNYSRVYLDRDKAPQLEFASDSILKYIENIAPDTKGLKRNPYKLGLREGMKGFFLALFAAVFSLGSLYWGVVPGVADFAARTFPYSYERNLGERIAEQVKSQFVIKEAETAQLQQMVDGLKFEGPHKLKVYVVKGSVMNAFALPGGHVFVYEEMLRKLQDGDELVALLGHEYTHVNERHGLRGIFRGLAGYAVWSLVVNDYTSLYGGIANNAELLLRLQYSRELERAADRGGMNILVANKINPQAMVRLFQRIDSIGGGGGGEFSYLSTHPSGTERIEAMQEQLKTYSNGSYLEPAVVKETWFYLHSNALAQTDSTLLQNKQIEIPADSVTGSSSE